MGCRRSARASCGQGSIEPWRVDGGIFHKMKQLAPGKKLIEAPTAGEGATCESCAHCPWMGMNALQNLLQVLEQESNEITIDPEIRERAVKPIQRMLDFASSQAD